MSSRNYRISHEVGWARLGYLVIISTLLNHFRGHPEGCAHKGRLLRHRVRELTGNTKVGKLHATILSQQNIGRLDITVNFPLLMEIATQTHTRTRRKEARAKSARLGVVPGTP